MADCQIIALSFGIDRDTEAVDNIQVVEHCEVPDPDDPKAPFTKQVSTPCVRASFTDAEKKFFDEVVSKARTVAKRTQQ